MKHRNASKALPLTSPHQTLAPSQLRTVAGGTETEVKPDGLIVYRSSRRGHINSDGQYVLG